MSICIGQRQKMCHETLYYKTKSCLCHKTNDSQNNCFGVSCFAKCFLSLCNADQTDVLVHSLHFFFFVMCFLMSPCVRLSVLYVIFHDCFIFILLVLLVSLLFERFFEVKNFSILLQIRVFRYWYLLL